MKFIKGFEKAAGIKTETVGALAGLPLSALGLPSAMLAGPYSKEQQEKADKGTWSNLLLGPVAGHRLTRRLLTEREENAKKHKKGSK